MQKLVWDRLGSVPWTVTIGELSEPRHALLAQLFYLFILFYFILFIFSSSSSSLEIRQKNPV